MADQLTFEGLPGPDRERAEAIAAWWRSLTEIEIGAVIPKAIEYGSADLKVMGRAMVQLLPNHGEMGRDELERIGQEMAIAFYAPGKVARLFGAYEQGRLPSDDTWHDLGVYCRMAQRVRAVGHWG